MVADVYQEWFAGASPAVAHDVSMLFGNAMAQVTHRSGPSSRPCADGPANLARDIDSTVTAARAGDSVVECQEPG